MLFTTILLCIWLEEELLVRGSTRFLCGRGHQPGWKDLLGWTTQTREHATGPCYVVDGFSHVEQKCWQEPTHHHKIFVQIWMPRTARILLHDGRSLFSWKRKNKSFSPQGLGEKGRFSVLSHRVEKEGQESEGRSIKNLEKRGKKERGLSGLDLIQSGAA